MKNPFETLKALCTEACHERKACAEGYRAMDERRAIKVLLQP